MKILVCAKQVPDSLEVRLKDDLTLERDFVAQVMNPADESALELGLILGRVTVMTMGRPEAAGMLREALARGAQEAVLLTGAAYAGADTLATARTLAAAARHLGPFDLILLGRRASDGETGQVGPMLASLLDVPCVPNATRAWLDESGELHVLQLREDGSVEWACRTPAVVTLCEWSHALRLPSLMGLKHAKGADIRRLSPEALGLSPEMIGLRGSPTRVIRVTARPVGARACRRLTVAEALEVLP